MDKSGVTAFYSQVVAALGPEAGAAPRLQVAERFVTGERLVCRFTMSGTHRGSFLGVPATNRPYAIDGITLLRFRADRCVERWSQADMLGLMVQIGAVPPLA
jgi:predicted ester cyclase